MNVKRWSVFAACVMVFFGAVSLEAGTFNALPPRSDTAICGVVHLEKAGEMCRRIGNSLLVEKIAELSGNPALGWLQSAPVESLSLSLGYDERGFALQGALSFGEGKKEMLEKLARGEGEEGDLDSLLDFPLSPDYFLVPFDESTYGVIHQGMALVLLSVEKDMLLVGFSPEDLAASREALEDPSKRMEIARFLPQENFFRFYDDGSLAEALRQQSGGILGEPAGALTAELGLACSEAGWELAMRNNLPEVYPLPEGVARRSPMAPREKILLGGGNPWLVAMSTVPLDLEHLQALRKAAEEGQEDAIQATAILDELAAMGVDDATLVGALKTLGLVMGGESRAFESPVPGGYLYISGEEEALEKLAPLMQGIVTESGLPFEFLETPPWDLLFSLADPCDVVVGLRKGLFLLGSLSVASLSGAPESTPPLEALLARDDLFGFLHVDGNRIRKDLISLLDPEGPWVPLIQESGLAEGVPMLIQGIQAFGELNHLELAVAGFDRLDLVLATEEPDPEEMAFRNELTARWMELAVPPSQEGEAP